MIKEIMARLGYVPKSELDECKDWYQKHYYGDVIIFPREAITVKVDGAGHLENQTRFMEMGDHMNIDILYDGYTKIELFRN